MRVLLINSNLRDDLLAAPPIGVCYVATATMTAGHEVHVLDLCFKRRLRSRLKSSINEFEPEIIGVSIRNMDNANLLNPVSYLPEIRKIISHLRQLTSVPVVVGGSGASIWPPGVFSESGADYIIVSDGEVPFVSLLEALERGGALKDIPGLGMISKGALLLNPPQPNQPQFGKARVSNWIDVAPYNQRGSCYNIQTKRGCLQKCIYCTYNQLLEGNSLRLRDPVDVVDEIEEALFHHKFNHFEFVDSVFNSPQDHCREILEEILRRPWQAQFTAMGVSPKGLDRPFLDLMWRAGFRSFMITPESGSVAMIENYRKGFSKEDLLRAVSAIQDTNFTVFWFFLIGGPGETNETLQESLDFARRYLCLDARPPYHMANFYLGVRLYPGTDLWKTALQEGLISEKSNPNRQLWYLSHNLDLDLTFEQLTSAAMLNPQIILGFDEKYTAFSSIIALFGKVLGMPKPYWRHAWGLNRLLLKTRIRSITIPKNVVRKVREQIESQGCSETYSSNFKSLY